MSLIILPSNPIRTYDSYGSGAFGARRGPRLHLGTDFEVAPKEMFPAMVRGKVIREKHPYSDDLYWNGVLIQSDWGAEVSLFYLVPLAGVIGTEVEPDHIVGAAQDIRFRYPADADHPTPCTPHVHVQVAVSFAWPVPSQWKERRDYIDYQGRRYLNVKSVAAL